ncbi:MAG: hypothetical protein A3F84_28680 [Candidatus Handelsmanbacteria bacterium RIFCSPLOWO2_12_FULL_64_10]|uniref:ABC transporter permease n=1 Tax=Handelsmanbacteria sp. (strain RIFCSPLOWO2_12_FULL_64_10) TaxID=1817868 RepID=A0A1F6D3X2_HANXR|nr:MAG: hypothetical protein A3F84_28680 [Candidatus Handelsmanbacteria bacterium RIFCSPLOWO2_12_FULL_64_10]
MFLRIVHKQLLEYLLSLRFLVGAALCLAVGVGATCVRAYAYRTAVTDYGINRREHHAEAAGYVAPFPLTYSGVSVDRPPALLGVFYRGLEPSRPMSVRVTGNRDPKTEDQYERANPILDLFQTVDLVSFTALVVSLLALVFSYDLISGEKEAGTLRLTLSFSVPRDTLLLGKWTGGYLALVLPFLLTALCCFGVVALYPGTKVSWGDLAAFGLLIGVCLLYIGGLYSLGLLVSTATSRSFTSIIALVAIWVGVSTGLPNLSPYVAGALIPLPTIQETERKKWAVAGEEGQIRGQQIRDYQQTTKDSEAQRGVVISEIYRESFAKIARRQEQIQADYDRRLDRQVAAATWLSRLSPTASLIYTAGEIAGTGVRDWRRFRKTLHEYRVRFLNYAEDKWIERAKQGGGEISTADYPRFVYFRPDLRERLGAAVMDVGLLAFWNLLFFVAGYVAFLRYDVR